MTTRAVRTDQVPAVRPDRTRTARLVRFQQPEKAMRYLGALDEARLAALFGLDPDAYRELLADFERQNREAAAALLAEPGFAELADRLPFRPGEHVVALGESTTADRLSWFEILRHLVPEGVVLTNLAVSGSSTTQALAQLPQLPYHRPDWVLCMLGANDAQRLGRTPEEAGYPGTPLVSPAETERNLLSICELTARTAPAARWIWLTPPGVDAERVAEYPHFRRAGISWHNRDLDALADFLLAQPDPVVDTRRAALGRHLDDGVHLSAAGQRAVAAELVRTLTAR